MTRWLRLALLAQLAVFALWGGRLLTSHRDVAVVWLATEPVDPRDLLSGHYVALRYVIASSTAVQCSPMGAGEHPRPVWVQLDASGDTVATSEGLVVVSTPVRCVADRPAPASAVWIQGTLDHDGRIVYGIERMFVGEDNPLRQASSGSVVAKVAVNEAFAPRLLALVTKQSATVAPSEDPP